MTAPRQRLGWLLVALSLAACAGPRVRPAEPALDPYEALPSWRYEPLSWAKLEAIEAWLAAGNDSPAGLRAEAELELAEGRLVFARRESSEADARVLAARVEATREGFRRVLADPDASQDQRARATSGLARARAFELPAPTAPKAHPLGRSRWGAGPPDPARLTPHRGAWSRITVHHSAIASSSIGRGFDSTARHLRSIQRNQMDSEGMGDIGYHFLIDPAGAVLEGRSLRWRGAHAGGRNNIGNLGICLLGNFDVERPSATALRALGQLTEQLRRRYGIGRAAVYGHKELKGTECPGTHLQRWVNAYRRGSEPVADAGAPSPRRSATPLRSARVR